MDEQPKSKTSGLMTPKLVYNEETAEVPFNEVMADERGVNVETLYDENFRDIPAMLRNLADEIEDGEFGEVSTVACALLGDKLEVFGWGENCDVGEVHLLLTAGAQYMVRPILDQGK